MGKINDMVWLYILHWPFLHKKGIMLFLRRDRVISFMNWRDRVDENFCKRTWNRVHDTKQTCFFTSFQESASIRFPHLLHFVSSLYLAPFLFCSYAYCVVSTLAVPRAEISIRKTIAKLQRIFGYLTTELSSSLRGTPHEWWDRRDRVTDCVKWFSNYIWWPFFWSQYKW